MSDRSGTTEANLADLISLWQRRRAAGEAVSAAELCRNCPELLPQLEQQIAALERMNALAAMQEAVMLDPEATRPPAASEQPMSVTETLMEGPVVPGYEVLGILGKGGMGVVYKARQRGLSRVVTLKMILHADHAGEAERQRFQAEAEAVARLQHPNIVQIYEVGEQRGLPYFSLEFCPGGSLADKLDGTPLPPKEAAALVQTLALATQAAHDKGILHRDLKPANVLLAEDGTPKITDFGLAKKLGERGRTQTGDLMGTPSYMSPEQALGKSKELEPASDVYALGAILYECLTGRPPFKAATTWDTLQMVTGVEPVAPCHLQPKVPRDLETICLKCLEKMPRKRYASALALAEDVRRFLDGESIYARPVGAAERGWRWCLRNYTLAGVSGLAVAALIAATVVSVLLALRQAESAIQSTETAETLARKQAQTEAALREARHKSSLLALERGFAACEQGEEAAGLLWFARSLREAPEGDSALQRTIRGSISNTMRGLHPLRAVSLHQGNINAVAFSPDGRLMLTGSSDRTARLWDVKTGKPCSPPLPHRGRVWAVAFSPEGKRVVTGSEDKTARLWEAATGRPLGLTLPHPDDVRAVAFHPDGTMLLTGSSDKTARLWDAATGKPLAALTLHKHTVKAVAFSPDGTRLVTGSLGYTDRTARLWDTSTGKPLAMSFRLPAMLHAAAFSRDGRTLLAACEDGSVELRRIDCGAAHHAFRLPELVHALALSPDGQVFVTGGEDHTARLWDASTGAAIGPPLKHQGEVYAVAFGPDGRTLVTGSGDRTARLWDVPSGRPLGLPLKHGDAVWAVAVSPDGEAVLTGSGDKTARLWDVASCQPLAPPFRHQEDIRAVAFSPDGRAIVTGSMDHTARQWVVYPPIQAEVGPITLGASLRTGMELDEDNSLRSLDAETWESRRQQLNGTSDAQLVYQSATESRP